MIKKCFVLLICVFLLAAALAGCAQSPSAVPPADGQCAEALSAYREILEAAPALKGEHEELADASFGYEQNLEMFGKHYDMFALVGLNGDAVPELIAMTVVNFRWTSVSVYTYADGKAVLLKDPLDAQSPATFDQNSSANGAYVMYFCDEHHIHNVWHGAGPDGEAEEGRAYAMEGTTLVLKDCDDVEDDDTLYFSHIAMENTAENRAAAMN